MNKWDKRHIRDMSKYEQLVANLFSAAATEAAKLTSMIGTLGEQPFSWANFPLAQQAIQAIMTELGRSLQMSIVNGVRSQWTLSNNKNNELCQQVFGALSHKLPKAAADRYFNNHHTALEAFISRRDSSTGLSLSDKVWNYTNQFKSEIESALDIGIRSGRSADELSRDLRDYLKHPDKLFRRVRDEHGQLHLSQNAKAFHPGQGVYRSSYMNARRLAATETNIAYRTADHLRWQELDFVVGIKIQLSNNHNCKGVPAGAYYDICDELKGDYPKEFKFTGWHPHCRCIATSILKTEEELMADNERILNGEDVSTTSENEVKELPDNFTKWIADNQERIDRAKSEPYFLRDNKEIINPTAPELLEAKMQPKKSALEIAEERHANRTLADKQRIQDAWNERAERMKANEEEAALQAKLEKLDFKDNSEHTIDSISKPYDKKIRSNYEYGVCMDDYTSGSTEINQVARFGKLLQKSYNSNNVDDWKGTIKQMDKTINAMPKLDRQVDMFRSSRTLGELNINGVSLQDLNKLIGKKFQDKGYTSFSLSNDVVQGFNNDDKLDITIVLKAKKGTKGICLANTSAFNDYERQEEFLLPRGSKFEILGAKEIDGRKYLFVGLAK